MDSGSLARFGLPSSIVGRGSGWQSFCVLDEMASFGGCRGGAIGFGASWGVFLVPALL